MQKRLHHARDPEDTIGEATRVLRPGGQILILDLREHDEGWVRERFGDTHLGFSERTLTQMLTAAGYSHIRVSVGTRLAGDPFVVLVASGVKALDTGLRQSGRSGRRAAAHR